MFNDFIGWLTGSEPIARWLLIIMLLGLLGFAIAAMRRKGEQDGK